MEYSRQEHCSGLPFPSPRIFPTQGSNLGLLPCRRFFTIWAMLFNMKSSSNLSHVSTSWCYGLIYVWCLLRGQRYALLSNLTLEILLYWTAYFGIYLHLRSYHAWNCQSFTPQMIWCLTSVRLKYFLFFLLIIEKKGVFSTQIASQNLEKSDISLPRAEEYQTYALLTYFWLRVPCILSIFEGHGGFIYCWELSFFFSEILCFSFLSTACQVACVYLRKIIRLAWENEFMLPWLLLHCHEHFKWLRGIICINKNELLIGSYNLIVECWFLYFRKRFHLEL